MSKILLLGSTGKMGLAVQEAFKEHDLVCKNSKDFNAENFEEVKEIVCSSAPDILINTVAFLGIDPCEKDPNRALLLNTLFPNFLSELSNEHRFKLVHFSTDAVFDGNKDDFYVESDTPKPMNIYGFTKYGGDCFIQSISRDYYIFRTSILFGKAIKNNQFVEKMLNMVKEGRSCLKISDDIISSPSYSLDLAKEMKRLLLAGKPPGLYHLVNDGKTSLYDLIKELTSLLNLDVEVKKASYKDFPYIGKKNTNTPIKSEKLDKLRSWKKALKDYAKTLQDLK